MVDVRKRGRLRSEERQLFGIESRILRFLFSEIGR